jgi:hypothetical protein
MLFALAVGITLAGAVYGIAQLVEGRRGEQKTCALLSGDMNVRLQRIQIDYQQRRVICTDPEVLRYLEERFRRHEPEPDFLGTTYQLSLTYDGGGAQAFTSYWTDTGDFNLFLGEPGEGGKVFPDCVIQGLEWAVRHELRQRAEPGPPPDGGGM